MTAEAASSADAWVQLDDSTVATCRHCRCKIERFRYEGAHWFHCQSGDSLCEPTTLAEPIPTGPGRKQ